MKTNENVIYRCIADEHILIPVGSEAMDTNGLFVLTETGAIVWEKLTENKGIDEIVAAICREYDADEETVRADVESLIAKLIEAGLVTE